MNRLLRPAALLFAAALALLAPAQSAHAQGGGFAVFIRLFRPYHQVALAQLPEVEKELKLTEEQKTKTLDLFDTLNEERGALFQEAAGDFDSIREDMAKLNSDIAKEYSDALDETQRKRLAEIYAQANGPAILLDDTATAALKLTDEQKEKVAQIRNDARQSWQDVDWQSLSEEEANEEVDGIIAEQDKSYAEVLTEEQKTEFEKMKGEKLEIDLKNLPNPFGG
jgi:hypothetical protein